MSKDDIKLIKIFHLESSLLIPVKPPPPHKDISVYLIKKVSYNILNCNLKYVQFEFLL